MLNTPDSETDVSLISIEPVVAKKITAIDSSSKSGSQARQREFAPPIGHVSRVSKEPLRSSSRNNPQRKGSTRENGRPRARTNSLRHVKNSTEMLRQRSINRQRAESTSDASSNNTRVQHFTVGNVGNNGRIYLRPIVNPPAQRTQAPPFTFAPLTPPSSAPLDAAISRSPDDPARESILSTSQRSDSPLRHAKGRLAYNPTRQSVAPSSTPSHLRAKSLDDHQKGDGKSKDGTLKIVIDRSNSVKPEAPKQNSMPSLEVPIPTYRLGTPRFSTYGTATIRSSTYTRNSVSDYRASTLSRPDFERLFPSPPGQLHPLHGRDNTLRPRYVTRQTTSGLTRSSAALPSPRTYSVHETIDATMFDRLALMMNDPSVVRYSPKTGEITAATPARIIAQVSSDSFMDYELVSDFFLTFRTYLKQETLLSLLLARLAWAINRMSDDGRIIRIRTFAALRHWILNYFTDDFLVDRPLRVQFCDRINDMCYNVKHRSSGTKGDLKIIMDLKRCWNGRCALYWDSPEFVVDGQPEGHIIPGGIIGNRDSQLTHMPPSLEPARLSQPRNGLHERLFPEAKQEAIISTSHQETRGHVREISGGTIESNIPISPISELSMQPLSCSVPKKARNPLEVTEHAKGPHPVPSTASAMRPHHTHKRSASSSDSARGQMHIDLIEQSTQLDTSMLQGGGSLIRGNVFAPSSPFVDVIAPNSPTTTTGTVNHGFDPSAATLRPGTAINPGMKSILGSIRKALSSKQSSSTAPLHSADSPPPVPSLKGQTSTLPLNVAFEDKNFKHRKTANIRHHLRIDLLCAEATQSYQDVLARRSGISPEPGQDIGIALGNPSQEGEPTVVSTTSQQKMFEDQEKVRVLSELTTGSKSIIIINDIDNASGNLPAMSGALSQTKYLAPPSGDFAPENESRSSKRWSFLRRPSDHRDHSVGQRSSGIFGNRRSRSVGPDPNRHIGQGRETWEKAYFRSSSVGRNRIQPSLASASSTLDVPDSLQSSTNQNVRKRSTDPTDAAESQASATDGGTAVTDETEKTPNRLLRRRPGGDLRKHQNVHDLEPNVNRESVASVTTATDSLGGSVLVMANKIAPPPPQPVSLIKTHSSTRMRPSFEAAVAGFANIPDDDDNGIESTLLKLEGKYEPQPRSSKDNTSMPSTEELEHSAENQSTNVTSQGEIEAHETIPLETAGQPPRDFSFDTTQGPLRQSFSRSRRHSEIFGLPQDPDASSEDSYSSTPLLERGLSDVYQSGKSASRSISVPRPLFSRSNTAETEKPDAPSSHPSIEVVDETESMKKIPKGSTMPERSPTNESFLLDENEELSDLSSELSMDDMRDSDSFSRSVSPINPGTSVFGIGIPSHPLAHPPSPPHTAPLVNQDFPSHPSMYPQNPPTPDPSPTMGPGPFSNSKMEPRPNTSASRKKTLQKERPNSGHIPFILACDSEVLAQQLTLIEQAALTEVDWNDLVEMRWDNSAHNVLNWVNFISAAEVKGIDLVIGRFNVMVKWVVSQVVLTQNIHERARAITKYIRVAAHARRMHNYATMLQITIALTSIDVARLSRTWEHVKFYEKQLLREMEILTQPVKNFHELRAEMEGADLAGGCIPFVEIAGTRDGEPLVNFERYRTAATIVKNLLRLIDASSRYDFKPVEGVVERCLWMAALPDERIQLLSKALE
ncbi:MAG: hypothetical protein Q9227_005301 [Pyrenula ochraceoflavens]